MPKWFQLQRRVRLYEPIGEDLAKTNEVLHQDKPVYLANIQAVSYLEEEKLAIPVGAPTQNGPRCILVEDIDHELASLCRSWETARKRGDSGQELVSQVREHLLSIAWSD
jgi:hypothetical protein